MTPFPPARYTPPPPPEGAPEPQGYQPFQQYYRPTPPPTRQRRRGGLLGGLLAILAAVFAYGKYALVFLLKFGAVKTLITLFISLAAYAVFFGPLFAVGLVLMILVHEMGHVFEIRRQGMRATAPLFIPFFGAAIFQRQHPTDALKQAQIGIAGPIAGTVGATVAYVLYGVTHWEVLLVWASVGFLINLFNLIPLGMLDGGWVLAVVSKWFQVLGLVALAIAVFFLHAFGPFLLIILILGIPAAIQRFRDDKLPYYQSVPVSARLAMGAAWLVLVGYLGFADLQVHELLRSVVG
jgi:Zn-dependent protease